MPARLLLDNDFILKISTLDLIEEFTSLPFVRDSELRHIKALHFMIAKGKFGDYPPEGLQRAQSWISTFPYVEAVDPVFHDRIPLTPGIDTGEKLLLADLLQHAESSVFTGDKRCITAIGGFSAELREAFSGRILCLEAAVRAIVARYDFDRVAGKVRQGLCCDTAIRIVFGCAGPADYALVCEGLESYIGSITSVPGGTILIPWEALL